jgi:type I restriction enzyme S subunit
MTQKANTQYTKFKDSGVKWIGEVPEHWGIRYLFQVSKEHYISNKTVHHQNLLSLSYGKIVNKDINTTSGLLPASFDTYQIVEKGNIILRLTDLQNDQRSLRVGLVTEEGIITSAYICLETFKSIIPEYLYLLLHSFDIKKVFYSMGGGLRQGLNYQELRKLNVAAPPLTEQRAIADFLERKTLLIDAYIAERERELQHINELRQAEISNVVTRGLNPNARMKDSGIPWIGEVPEHWEIKKLRNYLKLVSVKNRPKEQLLSVTREQGIIVRDIESKEENHNFIPEDLSNYKFVKAGQFVINKMKSWQGSYGVSKYDGIVSPAYFVCDLNNVDEDFFSLAIRSKAYIGFFNQMSKGIRVDQWDLSPVALKEIPFFAPPLSEQRAIVACIEQRVRQIDDCIAALKQEIDFMQEYRQRLISDKVTGKVDVREKSINSSNKIK